MAECGVVTRGERATGLRQGIGGVPPSPLMGEGLGMREKVSHMVAVHGAALVAPYGGMSVGVAVVCSLLPSREKGGG
ncbi:hypothetical protein NM74_20320 [Aeromonas hydrophila]|nr:hypothetical protein NM74_20320 [Aeromonas hydrophila]